MESSLFPFFNPRGVAVVGASTTPEKLGYGTARNLIRSGYQGAIHFVSQNPGFLFNRPVYTDIQRVPDPVDLAVLIVPAQDMPAAIRASGLRGIKAAILISSGFREAGADGIALEADCLAAAREFGMRLIGPNCIGIINTHLPIDTTFLQPPMPAAGDIGFVTQSGAFCAAIIDLMRDQGFGFSQILSLGNQADVTESEALSAVAADEHTKVIVLYMESVSDGRQFVEIARKVTQQKPVIALKVGRYEAGQKAAASHTGALAGAEPAFEAAFEKAGVLRAETAEQMFDWARALADCPLPAGRCTAILTNAGGPGVIAADAFEINGLRPARLNDRTLDQLTKILPPAAGLHNPVDMLASASPVTYAACLDALLADSNVDMVVLILPPPPMFTAESVAEEIIPLIKRSMKPVAVSLMGSLLTEKALKSFEAARIPTYPFPERAVSALSALAKRAESLLSNEKPPDGASPKAAYARAAMVSPEVLLKEYGIQVALTKLAHSAEEAKAFAQEIGFPIVLKIASLDISHKSDVSGVILNLMDNTTLLQAYTNLLEQIRISQPSARIDGVHIQHQLTSGQEVIVGVKRDPLFGPLVLFGSGGIEVEGIKDVAFYLAPLTRVEAQKMLSRTWAGRKLKGFRNLPTCDENAVIDYLIRLSRLACENDWLEEIEINPLIVQSTGAVAVDVRMRSR